jgi:3-dehydroquinate synthase
VSLSRFQLRHPAGETWHLLGPGALTAAAAEIAAFLAGRTAFVVSTPRVLGLQGHRLAPLAGAAARWEVLEVPEGEEAKTLAVAEGLWRAMAARGGKRDSRVLAFGGGSVGDLAGFVAGAFLRGVGWLQVPTTLLAQVDAAIGGKTAVDLPETKNAVGLFHHPAGVVGETGLLATLPPEERRSGLVEVIKVAVAFDRNLLEQVETTLPSLLAGEEEPLAAAASRAARLKARAVEADPAEAGPRRLLNLGHTLGHALEVALGYRRLRHGEAVAYGLLFALRLAGRRDLAPGEAGRVRRLLGRLGLPPLPRLPAAEVIAAIARDKKAREGGVAWILPRRLGHVVVVEGIGDDEVREEVGAFLDDPWAEP